MRARALLAGFAFSLAVVAADASAAVLDDFARANREVRAAIDAGRFVDAENLARSLLSSLGGLAGDDQTAAMSAADLLLDALIENGHGSQQDAQDLALEVLRRRQAASPGNSRAVAVALGHLGAVLYQAGDYRRAAIELDRARAVQDASPGPADAAAAANLEHLAMALLQVGRYDDALTVSRRAVEITENLGSGGTSRARALNVRGFAWLRKGEYSRAGTDLERAAALEQASSAHHPDAATTLTLMGTQRELEGDSPQARDLLERALSLAEATFRPDHPYIPWILGSLAVAVQSLGDLRRARALQERALDLAESSVGPNHPLTADCLLNLAGTLLLQADYEGARRRYEQALRIYERRLGPDYPDNATVLYDLAILNAELGDFARASLLHRRAISSWEHNFGHDHATVARGLWEFGQTLADQHLDRQAVPLFERALAIRRRTLGEDNVNVAETLSSLAGSLARLGESHRALTLSTQAMRIWDKAGSPDTSGFVRSQLAHAAVLSAQGQTEAALDAYNRALRIQLPVLGPSHPDIAAIDVARAALLAQTGQHQESVTVALRAEETGRQHLSLTLGSLPERQALDYAAKRPQGLGLALSLVTEDRAASVLDAVIRGRSLVMDEIALRRRAVSNEAGGPAASQWIALRQTRERLANLVIRGLGSQRPEQYAALLSQAQQEKEDAERALGEQSAAFRSEASRTQIGLDDVRMRLPADGALVSIVRYDRQVFATVSETAGHGRTVRIVPSYLGFVLRSDGGDPIVVPLGAASAIDPLVARWRRAMLAEVTPVSSDSPTGPSFASIGTALRRRIWDPIAPHLGSATRVFVIPDGAFNLVPLAALPSGQGRYLAEDGPTIHYLSAERDLVVDEAASGQPGAGLLSVGGPAFSDGSSFAAVRKAQPRSSSVVLEASAGQAAQGARIASLRDASINCSGFRSMQFEALPASRNEAQVVASLWRRFESGRVAEQSTPQILTGPDATERAFKQTAPGHRILHVATHGFFLGDNCDPVVEGARAVGGLAGPKTPAPAPGVTRQARQPRAVPENPLLLSGLALAGANRRAAAGADEEDGILTAEEVAGLNLEGVQWAVLSACDTGLGTVISREGVLGLRRAFQVAGVRTVIMSLWPVDDRATVRWMEELYEARFRQNASTVDAVRDASVRVLRDRRAQHLSTNPFYWAAFVASGDWH